MPKRKVRNINSLYLAATGFFALATLCVCAYFNSWFGVAAYIFMGLSVACAVAGAVIKRFRANLTDAHTLLAAIAVIHSVLGAGLVWVILSQLNYLPKVPVFSDLDFTNYIQGWPVVELVVLGSCLVAAFKVVRPAFVAYLGAILAIASAALWLMALHFNLV